MDIYSIIKSVVAVGVLIGGADFIRGKKSAYGLKFENGNEYRKKNGEDIYLKGFIKNLCLRPSCYDCSFKGKVRESDITLADFWGIEKAIPEMDNDKGNSLLLINSQKGKALFEKIKDNITYKKTDLNEALKYNSAATQSVQRPQNRDLFINTVKKEGFEKIQDKFFKQTMLTKIKIKITLLSIPDNGAKNLLVGSQAYDLLQCSNKYRSHEDY